MVFRWTYNPHLQYGLCVRFEDQAREELPGADKGRRCFKKNAACKEERRSDAVQECCE